MMNLFLWCNSDRNEERIDMRESYAGLSGHSCLSGIRSTRRKAYENAGSYREAARRLDADQRTIKKLVVG